MLPLLLVLCAVPEHLSANDTKAPNIPLPEDHLFTFAFRISLFIYICFYLILFIYIDVEFFKIYIQVHFSPPLLRQSFHHPGCPPSPGQSHRHHPGNRIQGSSFWPIQKLTSKQVTTNNHQKPCNCNCYAPPLLRQNPHHRGLPPSPGH
jgi:hypothetical protein